MGKNKKLRNSGFGGNHICIKILIFLLITSLAYADFQDFGTDNAYGTRTDVTNFHGDTVFSASDETVQQALQTLDTSGVTVLLNCKITDNFCWRFEDNILNLYVNGKKQNIFPF